MDWLNLNWLSYFILAVIYVVLIVPSMGDLLIRQGTSYIESLKIGVVGHLWLIVFAAILVLFAWALNRVIH